MSITFQDIIDNLFYIHEDYNKQTNTRKVVIYNNDSDNKNKAIRNRLLSSVVILCFSREFTTHYKELLDWLDFSKNQEKKKSHLNK